MPERMVKMILGVDCKFIHAKLSGSTFANVVSMSYV